ncbi:uncharacterized protein LOC131221078 isoform X4 [Magnolia sinica]|uniref:uncharacterized protein LOC131221078 isoform X4 n=1 Tax=Magnolia sinica TaxID=86752 RepID=UPI00265A4356|nr:uncharacterized protein LOC131221078 isoform X4 [Magnolia sinica]
MSEVAGDTWKNYLHQLQLHPLRTKINQTLTGSNCKKVYRCWNLHSNAGNCDQIARFFYSSGKLFSYKESSAQELAQMFIQELALEVTFV